MLRCVDVGKNHLLMLRMCPMCIIILGSINCDDFIDIVGCGHGFFNVKILGFFGFYF